VCVPVVSVHVFGLPCHVASCCCGVVVIVMPHAFVSSPVPAPVPGLVSMSMYTEFCPPSGAITVPVSLYVPGVASVNCCGVSSITSSVVPSCTVGGGFGCVHVAFVPPLIPLQFQLYCVGVSVASVYVPVVHVSGVFEHVPLIGVAVLVAVHVGLFVPPLVPVHVQFEGVVVVGFVGVVGFGVPVLQ